MSASDHTYHFFTWACISAADISGRSGAPPRKMNANFGILVPENTSSGIRAGREAAAPARPAPRARRVRHARAAVAHRLPPDPGLPASAELPSQAPSASKPGRPSLKTAASLTFLSDLCRRPARAEAPPVDRWRRRCSVAWSMLRVRTMTRWRWTGLFLGAAGLAAAPAALTLAPRTAAACSVMLPPPALKGFPEDGAVDVPTDVRPFFDSLAGRLSDPVAQGATFTLTSDGGDSVPVVVRQTYYWTFELLPATELAPRSRYTLEGRWLNASGGSQIALGLAFTTGAGPVAGAPSPPTASMAHYALPPPHSTCDAAPHGTCVS